MGVSTRKNFTIMYLHPMRFFHGIRMDEVVSDGKEIQER